MHRTLIALLALTVTAWLLPSLPALGQSAPASWRNEDYPRGAARWYGVEVARFPSRVLAAGIENSLRSEGWGPVFIVPQGDRLAVVVGETSRLGDAHYLREELRLQDVADGRVVEIPRSETGASPRGFDGPLFPAFNPSPDKVPIQRPGPEEIRERLRRIIQDAEGADAEAVAAMLPLWDASDFADPAFSAGILAGMRLLWNQQTNPETILFLAELTARQEWPTTSEERREARLYIAELFQSHRRDWRAAWAANRAIIADSEYTPEVRAFAHLRQVSLLVELIERDIQPAPSFAELRLRIRTATDMLPDRASPAAARLALVYLKCFAWEGNWGRVEELARDFETRFAEHRGPVAEARNYLAMSLERTKSYDEAMEILSRVAAMDIPEYDWLRLGLVTRDPRETARAEQRRFATLKAEQDPPRHRPAPAPAVEEEEVEEEADDQMEEGNRRRPARTDRDV